MTEADHRIKVPLLALWGAEGTVGKLWDLLTTWRSKSDAPVTRESLPCGYLLPEEHDFVISHFRRFFTPA